MSIEHPGHPLQASTYHGFAVRPRPRWVRGLRLTRERVVVGVAAAAVLGLALGLWSRPPHYRAESAATVLRAPTPAESQAAAGQIRIVVNPPPKPPPVKPGPRLTVLPADMAAAAPRSVPPVDFRMVSGPPAVELGPQAQVWLAPTGDRWDGSSRDGAAEPPPAGEAYDQRLDQPELVEPAGEY